MMSFLYSSHPSWQWKRTWYRLMILVVWTLLVFWNVTAETHRYEEMEDDPYFVVSTVDGSIGILKAFDGTLVGGFRSGSPLVGPSEVLSGGRRIVPGLDGRLYVSLEYQDGLLQPLEITVLDVLQSPVKTCKDQQNCGIVTATKSTSLFALDARTGRLVWKQSPNGTTMLEELQEQDPIVTSTVLLQREDVLVQQLSTDSGESVWNVTLGTVQALEFGEANRGSESLPSRSSSGGGAYLPSGDAASSSSSRQLLMQEYYQPVELPCIVFGPDGTTLMAVLPTRNDQVRVLWRRVFPTVVASVFGLQGKTWKPLTVLEDPDLNGHGDRGDKPHLGGEPTTPTTTSSSSSRSLLTIYQPPLLQRLYQFWSHPMSILDRLVEDWFLSIGQPPRRRHFAGGSSSRGLWPSLEHNHRHPNPIHNNNNYHNHQMSLPRKHTLAPLYDHLDLFATPPRHYLALPSSPLLEDYSQHDARHGVFLTWPILVGICIVVVGVAALVFRFLYLQKKTQWIQLLQRIAPGGENPSSDDAAAATAGGGIHANSTAAHNANLINAANSTLKRSHSLPDVGGAIVPFPRRHRSESLQINYAITGDDRVGEDKETAVTEGNTSSQNQNHLPQPPLAPAPEPQTQGVGFLVDGIPLIRYNRYDSEFSEVIALGKGGFGTVFRCKNVLDGREYAIKKVSLKYKEGLPLEEFRQRLQRTLREVKSLALLDHPNIVRYYTAWLELQQQQLQKDDNDETRRSSQQLADSEYYLFSPTAYTDKSHSQYPNRHHQDYDPSSETTESRYHHQHYPNDRRNRSNNLYQHSTSNPLGTWHHGLNNHSSTNEPSFEPLVFGIPAHLDDYGFTFDRGDDDDENVVGGEEEKEENVTDSNHYTTTATTDDKPKSLGFLAQSPLVHRYSSNYSTNSAESSIEGSTTGAGWHRESRNSTHHHLHGSTTGTPTEERDLHQNTNKTPSIMVKHILYIQMQFCSQKTLADFLSNPDARKGGETSGKVDIPYALSLFLQIAQGVQHVHSQGLIHRDLKPNNCFIDDAGAVKVGDFGLSRESANDNREGLEAALEEMAGGGQDPIPKECCYSNSVREITAGVGTRSYASPEQMKGSDYDASTDIYSLGIILFELCYPMYTGMERTIVLSKLREHTFPDPWMETVRPAFPTLHTLLQSMISNSPANRPSAEIVVRSIQTILEGFTISSIDKQHHENAILLRVEAKPRDDVLRHTMKLVEDAASPECIEIVQYGLRGGTNKAVMEFAIAASTCTNRTILGNTLVDRLGKCEEVLLIRQVSGTKYTYVR